ncbi:hypothetical protein ACN28S_60895 [Cystobacter fuscus]
MALAHAARCLLDTAGLAHVRIFASGGLDEDEVARLLADHAPIDAFGVGTAMGVSADAPALDMAYKLVEYAGRGRLKLSTGKVLLPGRKQVFREEEDGVARRDVLARHDEALPGRPLLRRVMHAGRRLVEARPARGHPGARARGVGTPAPGGAAAGARAAPLSRGRERRAGRGAAAGDRGAP